MAGVFISYRRTDGGGWAGRLNDHLALRFGSKNVVWQDVEKLKIGKDYLPQILEAIEVADAVLIVIGPHWLKEGRKKLGNPEDVLRIEIERALRSRAAVIPTLVGEAEMPPAAALPRAIAGLVDRQGITLSDTDWARSMQILFEKLRDIVRSSGTTEPLGDLHSTLLAMQSQYFAAIAEPPRAADIARQALRLLDRQMPSYPQDHYLQMFRGYFLKNEAMSLRDLGDAAGFQRSLAEADRAFQTIRTEAELYLSNAYNGLGSVTLLQAAAQHSRRQGKQALQWIDKALALVPNHPYALHDRQETMRFLGGRRRA